MTIADRAGSQQITFLDTRDLGQTDEVCANLRRAGVGFVKEPADNPRYRINNAFVRDPNGYLVEIQRFWESLV